MQNALRLASVSVEVQSIALGLLLILSVVIPTFAHQAKSAFDRVRRGRRVRRRPAGAGEASQSLCAAGGSTLKHRIACGRSPHCRSRRRSPSRPAAAAGATTAPSAAAPSAAPLGAAPSGRGTAPARRRPRPPADRQRRLSAEGHRQPVLRRRQDRRRQGRRRARRHSSPRSARTRREADLQIPFITDLTTQGVNAIIISADGKDEVAPALKAAMAAGIKVVGFDSSPAVGAYDVFVNQADFSGVGVSLVRLGLRASSRTAPATSRSCRPPPRRPTRTRGSRT